MPGLRPAADPERLRWFLLDLDRLDLVTSTSTGSTGSDACLNDWGACAEGCTGALELCVVSLSNDADVCRPTCAGGACPDDCFCLTARDCRAGQVCRPFETGGLLLCMWPWPKD